MNTTPEEKARLHTAIDSHIGLLYAQIEGYRSNGNAEAIMDCYNEIRKYRALKNKI